MSVPIEQLLTVAEMGAAILDPDSPHYLTEQQARLALAALVMDFPGHGSNALVSAQIGAWT